MSKPSARSAIKAVQKSIPRSAPPAPFARRAPTTEPLTSTTSESSPSNFRRNKSIIYAVGVAVITCTGAILGAQWKTYNQERERSTIFNNDNSSSQDNSTEPQAAPFPTSTVADTATTSITATANANANVNVNARLLAAQIQALEDTKARLAGQKERLEVKIQNLHERKARREREEEIRMRTLGQRQEDGGER